MNLNKVIKITKEEFEKDLKKNQEDSLNRCISKNNNIPFSKEDIRETEKGFYISKEINNEVYDLYLNKKGLNIQSDGLYKSFDEALSHLKDYEKNKEQTI